LRQLLHLVCSGVIARGIRNTNPKNVNGAIAEPSGDKPRGNMQPARVPMAGCAEVGLQVFRQPVFHAPACRK